MHDKEETGLINCLFNTKHAIHLYSRLLQLRKRSSLFISNIHIFDHKTKWMICFNFLLQYINRCIFLPMPKYVIFFIKWKMNEKKNIGHWWEGVEGGYERMKSHWPLCYQRDHRLLVPVFAWVTDNYLVLIMTLWRPWLISKIFINRVLMQKHRRF